MDRMQATFAAALAMGAMLVPVDAAAQSPGDWQFDASVYLYLPTFNGSTSFPGSGSDAGIDIDLGSLKFAAMGSLEARKGPWGGFTDIVYVNFENSRSGARNFTAGGVALPVGAEANAEVGVRGGVWTLAGLYRAVAAPTVTADLLLGVRMLRIRETLAWQLSGNIGSVALAGQGNREVTQTNWDAIVGVKGRAVVGESRKWFIPYYLDVGAGDSDVTWQAMAGVGYAFGWGDIVGSWRYLDYEMKSSTPVQALSTSGPVIAATFHW